MLIKIQDNKYVTLHNKVLQNRQGNVEVNIINRNPMAIYKIGFNRHPLQEVNNGVVTLPPFTNEEQDVIIKVVITQMGNSEVTIYSDIYPLTLIPVIGKVLEEAFPITLQNIIDDNNKFKRDMLKTVEDFTNHVHNTLENYTTVLDKLENEGEIV